jgi:hypothetical protein
VNTSKVTRLEIIDHTPCTNCEGTGIYYAPTDSAAGQSISFPAPCGKCGGAGMPGRSVVFWDNNKQVDLELQDDERTMKVFIHERTE